MDKEKGVISILFLLGVAWLLALTIYFTSFKPIQPKVADPLTYSTQSAIPSSTPSKPAPQRKTANEVLKLAEAWKLGVSTYQDNKINITFEYPTQFGVNKVDTEKENNEFRQSSNSKEDVYGDFFVSFYSPDVKIELKEAPGFSWNYFADNSMSVAVDMYKNPNNLKVQEFIKERFTSVGVDGKTRSYEAIPPGLKKATKPTEDAFYYEGSGGGENPQKILYFSYKDMLYIFSLQGGIGTGDGYSKEAELIYGQMIASIKLL
jgi:hypothetical protein